MKLQDIAASKAEALVGGTFTKTYCPPTKPQPTTCCPTYSYSPTYQGSYSGNFTALGGGGSFNNWSQNTVAIGNDNFNTGK